MQSLADLMAILPQRGSVEWIGLRTARIVRDGEISLSSRVAVAGATACTP
jgi:hypothetical protein